MILICTLLEHNYKDKIAWNHQLYGIRTTKLAWCTHFKYKKIEKLTVKLILLVWQKFGVQNMITAHTFLIFESLKIFSSFVRLLLLNSKYMFMLMCLCVIWSEKKTFPSGHADTFKPQRCCCTKFSWSSFHVKPKSNFFSFIIFPINTCLNFRTSCVFYFKWCSNDKRSYF